MTSQERKKLFDTRLAYGEEPPVCGEQNEECWQKNRHDRFVIKASPTS